MSSSYLEFYAAEIMPQLQEIDLRLKYGEDLSVVETAQLLNILPDEVEVHMQTLGIEHINSQTFLSIMRAGSSRICKLFNRELDRHSPITYTAEDVSYIYDLEISSVQAAFNKLNAKEVSGYMLARVLAKISR